MDKRLEEIEGRLAKATPGDWRWMQPNGKTAVDLAPDADGWAHVPECAQLYPTNLIFNGEPDNRASDARLVENAPGDLRYLLDRVKALEQSKDGAYSERNKLVAALSKLFPASLERHDENDKTWEDDWRWIVFINLPTGQVSWHIHDSELNQFSHLHRICGRVWDGHTTKEKYDRLAALLPKKKEAA